MTNNNEIFKKKKLSTYIKLASGMLVAGALGSVAPVMAQNADANDEAIVEELVVTGQRKSIETAQMLKKNATQIVDSIAADDLGKLPDRSVTDALSRLPGVQVNSFISLGDPEHFSGEGSGVAVRGLTHVQGTLNGRESFSANGGRSLSFEDVPTELMAGVDVYKNPTADMIEGGLAGIVNLRTRMPFDSDGQVIGVTIGANYGDFIEEIDPSYSVLYSNSWDTDAGRFGFLVDIATSEVSTRTDSIFQRPLFTRTDLAGHLGEDMYVPRGADYRTQEFNRKRNGAYAAFQWAPSDSLETFFTVFNSQYDFQWHEDAIFVENDPLLIVPSEDSVYDENNVFVSGRLTSPEQDGIPMGADIMLNDGESETTDYSIGFKWTPTDRLTINSALQYVKATNKVFNSTVATQVYVPYLDVDYSGKYPSVTSDNAYLADPGNYNWGFTMDQHTDNLAEQYAFNLDAEYAFDDSVITSVKVGARFTDRTADNLGTTNWAAVYQSWMKGWALPGDQPVPTIDNPELIHLNTFDNFFRGDVTKPAGVLAPIVDVALGYPGTYNQLHDAAEYLLNEDGTPTVVYTPTDLTDPKYHNDQSEKTAAAYVNMAWSLEQFDLPFDGNIGIRVVETDSTSSGFLLYPTRLPFGNGESEPIDADNSYTNVLPTMNLRWSITDDLFFRFAMGKAMVRPAFWQMQAYQTLNAGAKDGTPEGQAPTLENTNFTSDSDSNPYLKPIEADQFDISLEWYFNDQGGMVHANLFRKDLEGFYRKEMTQEVYDGITYDVTRPINTGTATIQGIEIGYKQFFDMLPAPFDGFGIEANYTYIDSETNVPDNVSPVDTDGSLYGNMPYEGLSENTYNLNLMYEKGDWSTRLAYNYRSEYLMSVGANGYNGSTNGVDWKLPVYQDGRGQLDGSINYRMTDNITLSLEANNLTNEDTRTYADQNAAGDGSGAYFVNDTRYALTLRANF